MSPACIALNIRGKSRPVSFRERNANAIEGSHKGNLGVNSSLSTGSLVGRYFDGLMYSQAAVTPKDIRESGTARERPILKRYLAPTLVGLLCSNIA